MGRWSQARRRGTCQGVTPGFALPPPGDEVWQLNSDGFTEGVAIIISSVCAVGADGFILAVTTVPGLDPNTSNQSTPTPCSDPAVVGGFEPEDSINGWIRWTLGGEPVSDWSNPQTIPIS
jgi:hypothetical protein